MPARPDPAEPTRQDPDRQDPDRRDSDNDRLDPVDQERLDDAFAARDDLTDRLRRADIPSLDAWSDSIIHATRADAVRRLHDGWVPFFGRIDPVAPADANADAADPDTGPAYIGPYAVHSPDNRLLVQSWRAPASAAFYEASATDPLGVARRRRFAVDGPRITGVVEEDLGAGHDDLDTLRDAIVRQVLQTRTGSMQDIMTTITPEQHEVIRADAPVTVLQGGPGTGKTAVGLHRIAYLLYAHRDLDALVVGPSDRFIAYVQAVLPALGEDDVRHLTLAQLGTDPVRLRLRPTAPRHLLGDQRIEGLLDAAAWAQISIPEQLPVIRVRDRRVTLTDEAVREAVAVSRGSGLRYLDARAHFRAAVVGHVAERLKRRLGLLPSSDVLADIESSRGLAATMRAIWPSTSAGALLRRALADPDLLTAHLGQEDGPAVHRAVIGTTRPRSADTLLTALHELAGEVLGEATDLRRYGHVVADEAQELTPVELRMIRRRMTASAQVTLLGDLAQQMGIRRTTSWAELTVGATLRGADVRTLDTSYRVPADLLALAAAFAADPALVPTGIRPSQTPPSAIRTDDPDGVAVVQASRHPHDTVGIIASTARAGRMPPPQAEGVSVVPLAESRGLEFGHVVLVEPAELLAEGGAGGLYIALTRAVKSMVVVHRADLPEALAVALAAMDAGVPAA